MLIIPFLLFTGCIALYAITTWKSFEKAGEPGWQSLIPIYNAIVFLKIVGKPWWWLLLMCIPLVNYVFLIWSFNMFSKSFGKDSGFTAGLVFFGFIFFPIIAFGDAEYLGPYGDPVQFAEYKRKRTGFDFEKDSFAA